MKFSLSGLRGRAVILVLLAILPLLGLTLYSYFDQRERAIGEVQRTELVAAQNLATIQGTLISNTGQLLATLARMPQVQHRDRDACNALFAELLKQSPHSVTFAAADSEGRVFASAPAAPGPVNYADRPWFQKIRQTRNLVIGRTVVGRISGKLGSNLAYPILDDAGRLQGVITTQLDLDWLGGLLAKSDFPPSTAIVFTDSSRKVLFRYPEPQKYFDKMLPEVLIRPMANRDEGVAAGMGLPGDARLFAFARLSPPWREMWVFIGLSRDWAVAPVNRLLWRNLIYLGLVALFALAAAWYGGELFVVRPVKDLLGVTERLAAGDLTVRAGPDYREGELGLLAHSFDQMADSLQGREEDLRRAKDGLEQRVEERTEELQATLARLEKEMSERQQAEEDLRKQADLIDLANDAILVRDLDSHVVFWNRGAEETYGWKQEEALGQVTHKLLQTKFPISKEDIDQELLQKSGWEGELVHTRADGSILTVASRQMLQRNDRGEPVAFLEINRDITERQRAEEAVRVASAYSRSLIEASLDPLVTISPEGKITDVNKATEAATGIDRARLVGTDFSDYFTEPDKARQGYQQVFSQGLVRDYPLTLHHASGRDMDVLYNAAIYRNEAGEVQGVFAAARDITERQRAEQELARLNEELELRVKERTAELERSNRDLEDFAYISSHDMQEPLRKIANFSEMIAKQYQSQLDERAARYLGYVNDGAKRMQALINDLLSYSRVGRAEIPLIAAPLDDILKSTLSDLHALIKENHAEISHDPLPTLKVNPFQMEHLLQNLISNAIKFHGGQPARIHLAARQEGKEWVISIRDNGIGFEPQYAESIFKVFKRLHAREEYPGTGIGLAICKKIVERHGGRIWAESEPGRGATFYFTIPS